jgi:hypothetical protein
MPLPNTPRFAVHPPPVTPPRASTRRPGFRRFSHAALTLATLGLGAPTAALADDVKRNRTTSARAATLMVSCAVHGASVEVDGQSLGETPMALPVALAPGKYTLRVQRLGHAPFEKPVVLRAGRDLVVEARLVAVRSVLRVDGEPAGARVLLDGRFVGLVPFFGEVEPGPALLEVRADGFAGYADRVDLEAGVELMRRALLTPMAGIDNPNPGTQVGADSRTDDGTPIYGRWWFWAGVGTAVAAAVVVGVVLNQPEAAPAPEHTLNFQPIR